MHKSPKCSITIIFIRNGIICIHGNWSTIFYGIRTIKTMVEARESNPGRLTNKRSNRPPEPLVNRANTAYLWIFYTNTDFKLCHAHLQQDKKLKVTDKDSLWQTTLFGQGTSVWSIMKVKILFIRNIFLFKE